MTSVDVDSEGDRLQYIIDAIRPFIVEHVKCLHLLPFMPFLRADAARIQKKDRSGDHRGAAQLFLERLAASTEPGRYAAFRDALEEAGFTHVAKVLDGGDIDQYDEEHRNLIGIFSGTIIDEMDPITMVDVLRTSHLLTESDEDEIRQVHREHSRYDAALMLLSCVSRYKTGWYDAFMSAMLRIHPSLMALVDPDLKIKKEQQRDPHREVVGESEVETFSSSCDPHREAVGESEVETFSSSGDPHREVVSESDLETFSSSGDPHREVVSENEVETFSSSGDPHREVVGESDLETFSSSGDPHREVVGESEVETFSSSGDPHMEVVGKSDLETFSSSSDPVTKFWYFTRSSANGTSAKGRNL